MRYEILAQQFCVDSDDIMLSWKLKQSNDRILIFLYYQTDIYYLEDIEGETLYHYIQFHQSNKSKNNRILEAIQDVKAFLFFLKNIRKINNLPIVDLSLTNISFWRNIDNSEIK